MEGSVKISTELRVPAHKRNGMERYLVHMTQEEPLHFAGHAKAFTLGVEMELQALDSRSLRLAPKAPELLARVNDPHLVKEIYQSMIELVTGVCDDVLAACRDLELLLARMAPHATELGVCYAGTGTNPVADYNERVMTPGQRYHRLLDKNQWMLRRMSVFGLHMHIGMRSGDACIRFLNQFLHVVPHFIALSASSPFWRGIDTGMAASRPTVYEAHPTAGIPPPVHDWYQFQKLYSSMMHTGSIETMKDLWWDIRPSPGFGTLELRMCDGPASMLELGAIVAFAHGLAHMFQEEQDRFQGTSARPPKRWIARENKWRALRYGLNASLIDHRTLEQKPLRKDIMELLERMTPFFIAHGYHAQQDCLRSICERGNSSDRQRAAFERRGNIEDVLVLNERECRTHEPAWT